MSENAQPFLFYFPNVTPIRFPCTIKSWSGVTNFSFPATSDKGMDSTVSPFIQTIRPNSPVAISSVAWPPKRVARLRSNGEGFPPRWVYPNTVSRVSIPVPASIARVILIRRTLFIRSLDTLGYYNDGIRFAPASPIQDRLVHLIDIVSQFRK